MKNRWLVVERWTGSLYYVVTESIEEANKEVLRDKNFEPEDFSICPEPFTAVQIEWLDVEPFEKEA